MAGRQVKGTAPNPLQAHLNAIQNDWERQAYDFGRQQHFNNLGRPFNFHVGETPIRAVSQEDKIYNAVNEIPKSTSTPKPQPPRAGQRMRAGAKKRAARVVAKAAAKAAALIQEHIPEEIIQKLNASFVSPEIRNFVEARLETEAPELAQKNGATETVVRTIAALTPEQRDEIATWGPRPGTMKEQSDADWAAIKKEFRGYGVAIRQTVNRVSQAFGDAWAYFTPKQQKVLTNIAVAVAAAGGGGNLAQNALLYAGIAGYQNDNVDQLVKRIVEAEKQMEKDKAPLTISPADYQRGDEYAKKRRKIAVELQVPGSVNRASEVKSGAQYKAPQYKSVLTRDRPDTYDEQDMQTYLEDSGLKQAGFNEKERETIMEERARKRRARSRVR